MLRAVQEFISGGVSFRGEYAHPDPFRDFIKNVESAPPKAPPHPPPPPPQASSTSIRTVAVVQTGRGLEVRLNVETDATEVPWFAAFYDRTGEGYRWIGGVVSDDKERLVAFDAFKKGYHEVFVYPLESECPLPNPSECMNMCFVQGDCDYFRPAASERGKSSTFYLS